MASKWFERMQKCQRRRISDPLYGLPIGNYPYIVHRDDGVKERYETFLMMRLGEPCSMVEQTERRSVQIGKYECLIENKSMKIPENKFANIRNTLHCARYNRILITRDRVISKKGLIS